MSWSFALLISFFFFPFPPPPFFFFPNSRKSFQRELWGESEQHESAADLKAQLESLETHLSFLMKLTGIQFTGHSKKTLERSKYFCALFWCYTEHTVSIHYI